MGVVHHPRFYKLINAYSTCCSFCLQANDHSKHHCPIRKQRLDQMRALASNDSMADVEPHPCCLRCHAFHDHSMEQCDKPQAPCTLCKAAYDVSVTDHVVPQCKLYKPREVEITEESEQLMEKLQQRRMQRDSARLPEFVRDSSLFSSDFSPLSTMNITTSRVPSTRSYASVVRPSSSTASAASSTSSSSSSASSSSSVPSSTVVSEEVHRLRQQMQEMVLDHRREVDELRRQLEQSLRQHDRMDHIQSEIDQIRAEKQSMEEHYKQRMDGCVATMSKLMQENAELKKQLSQHQQQQPQQQQQSSSSTSSDSVQQEIARLRQELNNMQVNHRSALQEAWNQHHQSMVRQQKEWQEREAWAMKEIEELKRQLHQVCTNRKPRKAPRTQLKESAPEAEAHLQDRGTDQGTSGG